MCDSNVMDGPNILMKTTNKLNKTEVLDLEGSIESFRGPLLDHMFRKKKDNLLKIFFYIIFEFFIAENIEDKWHPELVHYSPGTPMLLVGSQVSNILSIPEARSFLIGNKFLLRV